MDGFAKIIAIVFPLNGRYVFSPDFSSAFTSAALSNIFRIVALSKSSMCKKSFCPAFAVPAATVDGEEAVEEAWHEILRNEAGEETEIMANLPESGGDRRRLWPEKEE